MTTPDDDPRAEFDTLVSDALDALAQVVDDAIWTAHERLNKAMLLLDRHRWDAA